MGEHEFFSGDRGVDESVVKLHRGKARLVWRLLERWEERKSQTLHCGEKLSVKLSRLVGVTDTARREIESAIQGGLGLRGFDLKSEIRSRFGRELRLEERQEEEKQFELEAPRCGRRTLSIYQFKRIYQLRYEDNRFWLWRKPSFNKTLEEWVDHVFHRTSDLDNDPECRCKDRADRASSDGRTYFELEDWNGASELYESAWSIDREIGDRSGIARSIESLGDVHIRQNEFEKAKQRYGLAVVIYREAGSRPGEADAMKKLAFSFYKLARYDDAQSRNKSALKIYEEISDTLGVAVCTQRLGEIADIVGESGEARGLLEKARETYQAIGNAGGQVDCLRLLGDLERRQRKFREAKSKLEEALRLSKWMPDHAREYQSTKSLSDLFRDQGEADTANSYWRQAEVAAVSAASSVKPPRPRRPPRL